MGFALAGGSAAMIPGRGTRFHTGSAVRIRPRPDFGPESRPAQETQDRQRILTPRRGHEALDVGEERRREDALGVLVDAARDAGRALVEAELAGRARARERLRVDLRERRAYRRAGLQPLEQDVAEARERARRTTA